MITLLFYLGGWIMVFAGIYLLIIFGDLLILLIKYRMSTDNWEYPIDMKRFHDFCTKENERKNDQIRES